MWLPSDTSIFTIDHLLCVMELCNQFECEYVRVHSVLALWLSGSVEGLSEKDKETIHSLKLSMSEMQLLLGTSVLLHTSSPSSSPHAGTALKMEERGWELLRSLLFQSVYVDDELVHSYLLMHRIPTLSP